MADVDGVTLKLHYNVQPWVGLLTWNQDSDYGRWKAIKGGLSEPFRFPAVKSKAAEQAKS